MSDKYKLSDQQCQMLDVLWAKGEATVKDVQQGIDNLGLAYTTVATVLTRLEKKGVIASESRGREKLYRALVSEDQVQRTMVSGLVSNLFGGDPKALMAHLVSEGEFKASDLDELKALIEKGDD